MACNSVQAKAAVGKAAKPSSSQQGAAKAKEGNSNAAVAIRLLSSEVLTKKILEWAPEVRPALAVPTFVKTEGCC